MRVFKFWQLVDSTGMYVNTLPLLVDCKNQTAKDFIQYMNSLVYDIMKYNYYPFRLLSNEHNIDSSIIFQYVPDWFGNNNENNEVNKEIIKDMSDFISDFNVNIVQNKDNYLLNIMYSDKFSKDTIIHFAETYNLILSQILEVNKLSDINIITDNDIELLDSYNKTEYTFEHDDILDKFNENLTKYENNLLVGYKDSQYSHGEGAFIVNELGKQLDELGVDKQDFVALFVNRSEWFLLASMGVLSRDAIYVPIETTYPEDRITLMLEDSGSKVVIVNNDSEKRMREIIDKNNFDISVLNASKITENKIESSNKLDIVPVDENDVACVLYTSGTTGTPKGVLVTRKAINNFVSWYVDETNFTSDDVYGMHCSYVFDMHTHAIYSSVISGGSSYIVPEDIKLDLKALNDYFVEHNCTHTYITSQVGKLFAESGMNTTIKLLCFGGMKLGELNAPDSIGPFESYGPSENLAISTSIPANKRMHHTSIGRFISNVKGYVLDSEHRRVPLGAVGELYLSGHQLTSGYLNREKENEESFFENPFDDDENYNRIYKTGDIVRFLSDGTLGIVGRRDGQVKIRGNRVELPEVESVIRNIDYVEDVTVQTINNNGNNELISYVVISNDLEDNLLRDSICDYVSNHKPDYMVPSYVVKLDEIPLNVNGKVDKKALPDVDVENLRAEYVAPNTETEKIIVKSFEKIFNQEKISLYEDFIRIGGDSIIAIKLVSDLARQNIKIDARTLFKKRTPYNISQFIDGNEKEYGFELAKKGSKNQNMFLIPPHLGLSFVFSTLIKNIDFKGNIYIIDDYKYELSLEEIKKVDGPKITFEKYYEAIKDIFQDGDIIVGYSLGCIFAPLLCERLEKSNKIDKCILIDGTLNFINDFQFSDENINQLIKEANEFNISEIKNENEDELRNKMVEITISNSKWEFHEPKVDTPIIYLSADNDFKEQLDRISSDYEIIKIDSTHQDIIEKDIDKIKKYFK